MKRLMKIFILFTLFIISLFIGLTLAIKGLNNYSALKNANDYLHKFSLWVTLWRYALMLIFIGYYPRLIRTFYRNKDALMHSLSQRWIAILLCGLYELIIVHNFLGFCVNYVVRWL